MNKQIDAENKSNPCPNPYCKSTRTIRSGTYLRKSDGERISRFRCRCCQKSFSEATGTPCFGQNKRLLNPQVLVGLASSMSQNRLAKLLRTTRVTISRKLRFVAQECARLNTDLQRAKARANTVQFDELETFEHTKCKPLSVAIAVEKPTRRILGFKVSSMPAKGPLAWVSRRKYGLRTDARSKGLRALLQDIAPLCADRLTLMSDECPRYERIVRETLGKNEEQILKYSQSKGARGCSTGQGEIKKLRFDPLFAINHTCAMLRANVNRLFRRTWNTTKLAERLQMHLEIYAFFHNSELI